MSSLRSLVDFNASDLYSDDKLMSSQKSVLERRQIEVPPRESNVFGQQVGDAIGTNVVLSDRLTFLISDPRYYMNWANSYLSGEFIATGNLKSYLDAGGIASLVKKVTLRHGSQVLHEIDNFNKLYNIFNLASNSPQHRDYVMGSALDSSEGLLSRDNIKFEKKASTTITVAASTYTAATRTLTSGNDFTGGTNQPVDGQIVYFTHAGTDYFGVVEGAPIAASLVFAEGKGYLPNFDIAAAGITAIFDDDFNTTNYDVNNPIRNRVIQHGVKAVNNEANRHRFMWKIPFGMFAKDAYFPLPFLTQSLELIFEFVHPALGLITPAGTAANLGYQISRPRFVVELVEPGIMGNDDRVSIGAFHQEQYKGDGILYHFIDYKDYQINVPNGQTVLNDTIKSNLESAIAVFAVTTKQTAGNVGSLDAAVQQEASQSSFYKNNLTSYQLRAGGQHFPQWGSVRTDDVQSGQAWDQLMQALDMVNMKPMEGPSIKPWEWASATSDKFIIAVPLAKEKGGYANGINLSQNFLELEMEWGTATIPYTVHTFIAYDRVLRLQRNSTLSYY